MVSNAAPAPQPATSNDSRSTDSEFRPAKLGPHSRTWERTVTTTNGTHVIRRTNSITELQTGMGYRNLQTGTWEESDPSFTVTNGYAVADRCQHQLIVSPTLNDTNGVVID